VDDDFSQAEMMRGHAQQVVQEDFKTEVQKLDEELGNDYKTNQHVYRAMIAQINREEREGVGECRNVYVFEYPFR
jgi:hypothetical protein